MPERRATLYRIVLPDYVCPSGALARRMLEQGGFEVDERILATQLEADSFAAEHDGARPPQVPLHDRNDEEENDHPADAHERLNQQPLPRDVFIHWHVP